MNSGKDLKSSLVNCSSREEIDSTFQEYKVSSNDERIETLDTIMGNPETFYSKNITPDLQYQRKVSIFLTGSWKINDFYERAGL